MGRYGWGQYSSYNSYGRGRPTCKKCGGGHWTNQCETKCHRCGRAHYVTNCPQRNGGGGGSSDERATKRRKKPAWEGMLVKELKQACKDRGLPVSGVKAVLVKRIEEHMLAETQRRAEAARTASAAAAAAVAPSAAAAAPFANAAPSVAAAPAVNDDVYAMLGVGDGANDAAMLSQCTNVPGSDSNMPANGAAVISAQSSFSQSSQNGLFPSSIPNLSQNSNSTVSHHALQSVTKKPVWRSQTSTSFVPQSVTKEPVLTEEQKELVRLRHEVAQLKRMQCSVIPGSDSKMPAISQPSQNFLSPSSMPSLSFSQNSYSTVSPYVPQSAIKTPGQSSQTSTTFVPQSVTKTPVQSSQTSTSFTPQSVTKKPVLTEDQKERMRIKREEAQRKKMARLSAAHAAAINTARLSLSTQGLKAEDENKSGGTSVKQRKPAFNPYMNKKTTIKRDESKPDDLILAKPKDEPFATGGLSMPLSSLPPLPPDLPPVREETLTKLSDQQLEVIMAARPPTEEKADGDEAIDDSSNVGCKDTTTNAKNSLCEKQPTDYRMIRVNAAAGTGKTTTLLHLATRCIDLGHPSLSYVTYTKASAKDAQKRVQAVLDKDHMHCVNATTLHSCAMRLLKADLEEDEQEGRLIHELELNNLLKEHWGKAIEGYTAPAMHHIRSTTNKDDVEAIGKLDGKKKLLFEKALFYLGRTFSNFLKKGFSLDKLKDKEYYNRHYHSITEKCVIPGGSHFREGNDAAKLGFPPAIYFPRSSYEFFADTCVEIWDYVMTHGIRTYDIDMKNAQLKKLKIPCSVLLVDESQDLDQCQVAWAESQKEFGTHIFWVGDSAQCIYGFRGAKSSNVMKLDCYDTTLNKSWRFGPAIAKLANIVLFAKEKSKLTTEKRGNQRTWIPFRVEGARKEVLEQNQEDGEDSDTPANAPSSSPSSEICHPASERECNAPPKAAKVPEGSGKRRSRRSASRTWKDGPAKARAGTDSANVTNDNEQDIKAVDVKKETGQDDELVDSKMESVAVDVKKETGKDDEVVDSKMESVTEGDEALNSAACNGKEKMEDGSTSVVTGVTTKSLVENWQDYKPLTLIGVNNGGLMVKAMDLLGLSGLKNPEDSDGNDSSDVESTVVDGLAASSLLIDVENIPKFHINGKGEDSGANKWRKAPRQVRYLYELYTNKDETGYIPMTLPASEFKDFAHEGPVTWISFREICQVKEIKSYDTSVSIIMTYQQNTLKAIDSFESHITGNRCSEEEADIILTTCHSAKGLEWDHVEVCEGFLDLSANSFTETLSPSLRHPSFLTVMPPPKDRGIKSEVPNPVKSATAILSQEISQGDKRCEWQFGLAGLQDQSVNLLYVAMTRAKKTLSVPQSIKMLIQDFDRYHYLVETYKRDAAGKDGREVPRSSDASPIVLTGKNKQLTKGDVWNLYHDLCLPLRKELDIPDDCAMMKSLFPDECDEDYAETIVLEAERNGTVAKRVMGQPDTTGLGAIDDVADYFDV